MEPHMTVSPGGFKVTACNNRMALEGYVSTVGSIASRKNQLGYKFQEEKLRYSFVIHFVPVPLQRILQTFVASLKLGFIGLSLSLLYILPLSNYRTITSPQKALLA